MDGRCEARPGRFYERDVKRNTYPQTGEPDNFRCHGGQPLMPSSRILDCGSRESSSSSNVRCLQKLKKRSAAEYCRPWFYLSLQGLWLFQVVRGGIESNWGLRS